MGASKYQFMIMRERNMLLEQLDQMRQELDRSFEEAKEKGKAFTQELISHRHSNKKEEGEILDKGM